MYCDQLVCISVCLFVGPLAYLENRNSNFRQFLYTLPVAVARSSSDGNAICYVLTILRMTSCFCMYNAQNVSESKITCMFRPVRQVAAPVGRRTMLFGRDCQMVAPETKSAVSYGIM